MGSAASTEHTSENREALVTALIEESKKILETNPGNRCCKHLGPFLESDEGKALSDDDLKIFYGCVRTGIENQDSGLGCYAQTPADYDKFNGFFAKVIGDYHLDDPAAIKKHESSWDASSVSS